MLQQFVLLVKLQKEPGSNTVGATAENIARIFAQIIKKKPLKTSIACELLDTAVVPPRSLENDALIAAIQQIRQTVRGNNDAQDFDLCSLRTCFELETTEFTEALVEDMLKMQEDTPGIFDDEVLLRIHRLFWATAARHYNLGQLDTAVRIYLYSLSFPTHCLQMDQVPEVRSNVAWLYLKLGKDASALQSAKEELNLHGDNDDAELSGHALRCCYVVFRVHLNDGNITDAMKYLRRIAASSAASGLRDGLLGMAVTDAHTGHHREVAVLALESLCSENDAVNDIHLLRCLVRLKLGSFDEAVFRERWQEIIPHLALATKKLAAIHAAYLHTSKTTVEADWWSTIAWSLGIEACGYNLPTAAASFFQACSRLDTLTQSSSNQNRRQMCALMSVAASAMGLGDVWPSSETSLENTPLPVTSVVALEHMISECRQLMSVADIAKGLDDPTERMLRLYEFHAIANGPVRMDERLITLTNACTKGSAKAACKLLSTMGEIAKTATRLMVAMHAFQLCATRAMQEAAPGQIRDQADLKIAARALREQLQIACVLEKYDVAEDAAKSILSVHTQRPCVTDQDLRWIMTHLWNQGVELHSRQDTARAMKMCGLAMSFANLLSAESKAMLIPKLTEGMATISMPNALLATGFQHRTHQDTQQGTSETSFYPCEPCLPRLEHTVC